MGRGAWRQIRLPAAAASTLSCPGGRSLAHSLALRQSQPGTGNLWGTKASSPRNGGPDTRVCTCHRGGAGEPARLVAVNDAPVDSDTPPAQSGWERPGSSVLGLRQTVGPLEKRFPQVAAGQLVPRCLGFAALSRGTIIFLVRCPHTGWCLAWTLPLEQPSLPFLAADLILSASSLPRPGCFGVSPRFRVCPFARPGPWPSPSLEEMGLCVHGSISAKCRHPRRSKQARPNPGLVRGQPSLVPEWLC